jgi:uncharacterized damage-inducible protein DinB
MEDQLIETWVFHNRINIYLLDAVPGDAVVASLPPPESRTVYDLFAHIHNVRLMWLKAAAPDLQSGLEKLETKTVGKKSELPAALQAYGQAIERLMRHGIAAGGKIKRFKPYAVAFLGYMISHEAHHRGQIAWILRLSGRPLDKKTAFGLREWGVR